MKRFINKLITIILIMIIFGGITYFVKDYQDSLNEDSVNQYEELSYILVKKNVKIVSTYYDTEQNYISQEIGSGTIFNYIDNSNYVLTNFHVISESMVDSATYYITTYNGNEYQAEYIAGSEIKDLAILKFTTPLIYPSIEDYLKDENYVDPIEQNIVEFLDSVIAIGCPNGIINSVSYGEFIELDSATFYDYNVVKHTALLDLGSSGGMLYSDNGIPLGINTWVDNTGYYAIPISVINEWLLSLEL